MRKADKLFQLTNIIRAKQPITASQIAEEMEISTRSVYRYIDDLSVSGIPVYGTTKVGYRLHDKFELPPLNLTEKELDALILGVKLVENSTGDELSESARTLATKIEAVLPDKLIQEHSKTIYAPTFSKNTKDRETWELLYNAIKNCNEVSVNYNSLKHELTSRVIYPLGLFYWGNKWTVASWCTLRQSYRDFRLDRFNTIKVEHKNFITTKSINLDTYLKSFDEC